MIVFNQLYILHVVVMGLYAKFKARGRGFVPPPDQQCLSDNLYRCPMYQCYTLGMVKDPKVTQKYYSISSVGLMVEAFLEKRGVTPKIMMQEL